MKSTLIAMSCLVIAGFVACTSSPRRSVPTTGTAGSTGAAGSPTGAAGAGNTTGTAGDPTGAAGNPTGAAGDPTGAAGAATGGGGQGNMGGGGSGGQGNVGGGGSTGAAGDATGAAGSGAAGATAMVCNNSAVKSAGATEANCGAKTNWVASAMPKPPSKYLNIPDNQLQPQYAIDGDTTTRYSSGMTMAAGFYFQVDLGSAKMVSGIVVNDPQNQDGTYDVANGYDVGLSTDGTNFTTVATCMYSAAGVETVNFTATSARYVRYTNKGGPMAPPNSATSWLSIHEFDIVCN